MVDYDAQVERLLEIVQRVLRPLILIHNNPDPDAMAGALALRFLLAERLGVTAKMAAGGIVGRAENRAMMSVLKLPLASTQTIEWEEHDGVLLVDTQIGHGNNSLPASSNVLAVIDHHPCHRPQNAPFVYVDEDCGATSTLLTQFLEAAGLMPPPQIATALLYGIKSDTSDLSRGTTRQDIDAYLWLHALADLELLAKITAAKEPPIYFTLLHRALEAARLYGGSVAISDLGEVSNPDMIAEMADLLVRRENVEWGIIVGKHHDQLILSMRTTVDDADAGQVIRTAVGEFGMAGGHERMAGGQVPCRAFSDDKICHIKEQIITRMLTDLKIKDRQGRAFI